MVWVGGTVSCIQVGVGIGEKVGLPTGDREHRNRDEAMDRKSEGWK